jgi:hypothetical protein
MGDLMQRDMPADLQILTKDLADLKVPLKTERPAGAETAREPASDLRGETGGEA